MPPGNPVMPLPRTGELQSRTTIPWLPGRDVPVCLRSNLISRFGDLKLIPLVLGEVIKLKRIYTVASKRTMLLGWAVGTWALCTSSSTSFGGNNGHHWRGVITKISSFISIRTFSWAVMIQYLPTYNSRTSWNSVLTWSLIHVCYKEILEVHLYFNPW